MPARARMWFSYEFLLCRQFLIVFGLSGTPSRQWNTLICRNTHACPPNRPDAVRFFRHTFSSLFNLFHALAHRICSPHVRVQDAQRRSQRGSSAVGVVAAVDGDAQRLAEIPFARQQTQHIKGGVNGNVREVLHIIVIQNSLAHLNKIAQILPPVHGIPNHLIKPPILAKKGEINQPTASLSV